MHNRQMLREKKEYPLKQQLWARLANACEGSKSKELYDYPTPGAPVGRVAATEHARGRRAETMRWPDPGEEPAVKTTILEDDAAAKRAAELWVRENEGKAGSGTWMWWTDGSRKDDGRVGAAAVCLNGDGWTVFHSYLGMGRMEVFDAEIWAIGVALQKSVSRAEALRAHGATTVAVFSDSQAAIRQTAHLDPGPVQQLARAINEHARALRAHSIEVVIYLVLGH
jgi:ribonuclease HI